MPLVLMGTGEQMCWYEPWLFELRMRDADGWRRKGWLIAILFVAMMTGWYLDQRYGKGPRMGPVAGTFVCLGIAVFLGFLKDLGLSEIHVTDEALFRAYYGHAVGASKWPYRDIVRFVIVPPEKLEKPFGLLLLQTPQGMEMIGVPKRVSRQELTEFLQSRGLVEAQSAS